MSAILHVFAGRRRESWFLILDCGHWIEWMSPLVPKKDHELRCPTCTLPTVLTSDNNVTNKEATMAPGAEQANIPPHVDGKAKVKEAMAKHTNEQDRFRAGLNTILDNAKTIVNSGISPTEMTSKIEEFRGHLGELWSEIHAK